MSEQRAVVVLTTGGTIGSRRDPASGGVVPAEGSMERLIGAAGAGLPMPLRVDAVTNRLGGALLPDDLFGIALRAVRRLAQPDVAGVVVTAGTGIIEEGSYLCALLNATGKPVVWTGAQYDADAPDSDGPRNLSCAVRVAASGHDLGCVVCFNEVIHAARDVRKEHKSNVATFTSGDLGILGRADEDGVFVTRIAPVRPTYAPARLETAVDLIKIVSGSDDRFFKASVDGGARAIVVEGFPGLGLVSPGAVDGIRYALDRGVQVALAARSPLGRTRPKYGGGIGARDLTAAGVLLAGDLCPVKLRMLLMVLLGANTEPKALSRALAEA